MPVTFKRVESVQEFVDAIRLRVEVFIKEQGCPPGWEPDELDKNAEHFIAIVDNNVVATLRVIDEPAHTHKIERMVVVKDMRGKGIGGGLIQHVRKVLQKKNPKQKIWMQAQCRAQKFYEENGFQVTSKSYDIFNLNIPHVDMEFSA